MTYITKGETLLTVFFKSKELKCKSFKY